MQYTEVSPLLDDAEFMKICLLTGKSPEEVAKNALGIRKECELWNRCHIEFGRLMDVNKTDYDHSYIIDVSYEGRKNARGKTTYNCKTRFVNDDGQMFAKYKDMIGRNCLFYVSYVENQENCSVFRNLLCTELA